MSRPNSCRGAQPRVQAVRDFREAMQWLLADAEKGVSRQRYKGLGEMNSGDLAACVFNHATRRLLKLDAIKAKRDLAAFRLLISSDTSYRKRLLGFAASEDGEANPEDDDL